MASTEVDQIHWLLSGQEVAVICVCDTEMCGQCRGRSQSLAVVWAGSGSHLCDTEMCGQCRG